MDFAPRSTPRVAFSFRPGTFDLRQLAPQHCFQSDDFQAAAVELQAPWPKLFNWLERLGTILATVQSGPVCMADTWEKPVFSQVPGQDILMELTSGTEIHCQRLRSAVAAVEEAEDKQIASIQFFDDTGAGCLKLLLTNWSELEIFEEMICTLGVAHKPHLRNALPSSSSGLPLRVLDAATADAVRQFWPGLARTLPDQFFPGLENVPRKSALAAAGSAYAWQISQASVRSLMEEMSLRQPPMVVALRNRVSFLPSSFRPQRWITCRCGQTFFGECSQFTLRQCQEHWEAWVVRFATATNEVLCLEIFDKNGHFAGAMGLRPEATAAAFEYWAKSLREEVRR